jgi:hypothetical protein
MARRQGIRRRIRRAAAVVPLAIAATCLAACGGGGEGPVIGESDEFIERADEICLDTAQGLADARAEAGTAEEPAEAVALINSELPIRLDGLRRLQEVEAPSHQAEAWERFLAIQEDRVAAQEDALAAAQEADEDSFQSAEAEFERLSDEADELGARAGLGACANRLPPAGEGDVVEVVEDLLTSPDSARVCRDLVTENFVETVYGGEEQCEVSRGSPAAAAIDLLDVGGVESTSAFVDVEVQDFTGKVRQVRADLVFDPDSETWKVDYRQALIEPR